MHYGDQIPYAADGASARGLHQMLPAFSGNLTFVSSHCKLL